MRMSLRAWWARRRLPRVNARLERTWRAYDAAVEASRDGCRRYEPDQDVRDEPGHSDGHWIEEATRPLPWVDSKPLLTPAARWWAAGVERQEP